MLSAVFAVIFALSLRNGAGGFCYACAQRLSDGIMPEGAKQYCRRLTVIWTAILASNAIFVGIAGLFLPRTFAIALQIIVPALVILTTFAIEGAYRKKRFSVIFKTSGSTGKSKEIVKTFYSLAKETAAHRKMLRALLAEKSVNAGDVTAIATIDSNHMFGQLWRKMIPEACGFKIFPERILTPEQLADAMERSTRVFLATTPSFLERFVAYAGQYALKKNALFIVTSGSMLKRETAERTHEVFGVWPYEVFGSTETGGVAVRSQDQGEEFRVLDEVQVRSDATKQNRLAVKSPYTDLRTWYLMGDAVEMKAGERSFILRGRTDRLVKIREERINLVELEEKIRALGYEDCALCALDGAQGPYLGLVIQASAGTELATRTSLRSPLALRKRLKDVFPAGTVPKKIRVVRSIPKNAQGKVVTARIKDILSSALVEPYLLEEKIGKASYEARIIFDAANPCFDGHFDSFALLPGVVQLGLAARWSEIVTGNLGEPKEIRKMKFMAIIRPGDEVIIKLEAKKAGECDYTYTKGSEICSRGTLVF